MQRKQVKQVAKPKTATKAAGGTKPATKGAAKTATKGASKGAAKPATKAAPKATPKATRAASPAKSAAAPARKPAAKAPPKALAKAPAKAAPKSAARPAARDEGARTNNKSTSRSVVKPASRHRHDDTSTMPVPLPRAAVVAPIVPKRAFTFEDAGRTFNCRVEPLRPSGADAWWWFDVSTEQHQRHAPFRAEPGDSLEDVQARVVRYYDELLARRAEPAPSRWNRRPSTPGTAAVTAAAEGEEGEGEEGPDEEGMDAEGEENPDEPEMVDLSEAEGIADATA